MVKLRMSTNVVLMLPLLFLGGLLAVSNWRIAHENMRLNDIAHYYASLRHTPTGVKLPDLHGKALDGRELTISYKDVKQETLMFVFAPACPHCKRNWPVWQDLAKGANGRRVVFVNVGSPLPPKFSQSFSFGSATVMGETSPETILKYSLFESPITILLSSDGHSKKVWPGEIASSEAENIRKLLAWQGH